MTRRTREHLTHLALDHLDAERAGRWLALLRPAVHLRPAVAGEAVLARLGGTPALPPGTDWPVWEGHGRLSFVAGVDLGALAASGLDAGLALPTQGHYLAFYFDDPEGTGAIVYSGDPESLPGSRLVHVGKGAAIHDAGARLAGTQVLTWPDSEHPLCERAGLEDLPDDFEEALGQILEDELGPDVYGHQLGGWAAPVQGSVEWEAAETRLGRATYDEVHLAEAMHWRPLLQVDSDEDLGTSWGDDGCLYWLARTDGTSVAGTEDVAFTWQCG